MECPVRSGASVLLVIVVAGSGGVPRANAQDAPASAVVRPPIRAPRAAGRVVVDGRLDEAAWDSAGRAGSFIQQYPDANAAATLPSEVHVLVDDAAL
jgi:hypothetical protein